MFSKIKSRLDDMRAIARLCEGAEQHALQAGQREPGAEHFLLAAFDLPDGTARLAFERAEAEPGDFKAAIGSQYNEALRSIGIDTPAISEPSEALPLEGRTALYRAAPSGQELLQQLTHGRKGHRPLLGAHVVAAVASFPRGVSARALRSMKLDAGKLKAAAEAVIREKSEALAS